MKKTTTNPSASVTVAVDGGYGATKAVMPGVEPVVFPSIAGFAPEIKFKADDLAKKYPGMQISDDAGSWFVGDLAQRQLKTGGIYRMRGRSGEGDSLGIEFRLRMIKVALGLLLSPVVARGDTIHVRLATGLPVDHMKGAASLKKALIGQHRIQTDQTDFVANITDAPIMPQPVGALYSQVLTDKGTVNPCHTATRTGVVDVGMYTVDVAYDNDGEYIDGQSGSVPAGVFTVQELITKMLRDVTGDEPDYADVEKVLRTKCLRIRNKDRDFKREVDEFLEPLRVATRQLMIDKWGGAATTDLIYVVGGGAPLVFDEIKSYYEVAQLVDNHQTAIAQGYLNYALASA